LHNLNNLYLLFAGSGRLAGAFGLLPREFEFAGSTLRGVIPFPAEEFEVFPTAELEFAELDPPVVDGPVTPFSDLI